MMNATASLAAVRLLHTVIWLFFASCIVALPVAAMFDRYDIAGMLMLAVLVEIGVLLLNHMRCPMTDVAARFTTDRRANFDICLPLWLARHNKTVFGCLFVIGVVFVLIRWRRYLDA